MIKFLVSLSIMDDVGLQELPNWKILSRASYNLETMKITRCSNEKTIISIIVGIGIIAILVIIGGTSYGIYCKILK